MSEGLKSIGRICDFESTLEEFNSPILNLHSAAVLGSMTGLFNLGSSTICHTLSWSHTRALCTLNNISRGCCHM